MKTIARILLLVLLIPPSLPAQSSADERAEERRTKLELILRAQDTRTIHDGKLIRLLSDEDPIVRERAVHAFGNIQDTSVISLLVDRLSNDPGPAVQDEAAFAIGQTGGLLSKRGRQSLQHDLIWVRLDKINAASADGTGPADRLIEELGKFGTEEALTDLLGRFGNTYPPVHSRALVRSIARFAIRGVTTAGGVAYLLKLVKPPERADWQTVYALQRIGDHPGIRDDLEDVVKLHKHDDPLVRMNCAILLGKVKNETVSLLPLQKLAEFDPDWHVKVNALKALGNFNLNRNDELIQTFRRLFFDGNTYVALTALSVFGTTGLSRNSSAAATGTFSALERIAANKDNGYLWQLQAEAAAALAKLEGAEALPLIKPAGSASRLLEAGLLVAAGTTRSPEAWTILSPYLGHRDPLLYRSALEGLRALGGNNPSNARLIQQIFDAALAALSVHDVAIVTTAASILGDSLFRRSSSVEPLMKTLERLRVPDDVEAMQEIAAALGKLNDRRAVDVLQRQLGQPDRSVAMACASALESITGSDYSGDIPKFFEPLFADFDFAFLRSLPDIVHVRIETIRGDITLDLYKNVAPFTVMSFLKLATQRSFYRGLTFHRVVPNFVIQGGDPRGDGWGGPGYSIRSEFSALTYETGSVGIASAGRDTEGSQFFITQSPQPHLDGRYTLFGKVIAGMETVDKILVDDHIFDVKIIRD